MIRRLQYLNLVAAAIVFLCWIYLAVYDRDPRAMLWLSAITVLGVLWGSWLRRQAAKERDKP